MVFFACVRYALKEIFLHVSRMLEKIFFRVSGMLEKKCFCFACVRYA